MELKSIQFTSDHAVLKKNPENDPWGNSNVSFEKPEWVSGDRSNPISHTGNTPVTALVTVKVSPSGKAFDLLGRDPDDDTLIFQGTGNTSTGEDQAVAVTSTENFVLPNQIRYLLPIIQWYVKYDGLEHPLGWSSHTIYVTYGTPSSSVCATQERVFWSCVLAGWPGGLDAIATAIRDKAKAGTHFGNYTDPSQMPNPIWKALLKDENDHNVWDVDCYRAAAIVVEALRLLGIPGVGAETVYATTDLNLTAVEEQACSNHETVYLRYATEYPPRSVNDPTGGYLNQFQGCFIITVDENFHYYSVYPPIGPFANPNGRLKVLHGLQDYYGANQFGQWWSYDVKDGQGKTIDRLKDLDEQHGSEVPLPAIP